MKKRLIRVMSSLMFVCLLAGCGSKSSSGNAVSEAPSKNEGTESVAEVAAAGDAEITLEFGHIQNPGHALAIAPEEFKNLVEEKSGGRVAVNIYPSSQLGSAREMMEQVTMGTLDMTCCDTADCNSGRTNSHYYSGGSTENAGGIRNPSSHDLFQRYQAASFKK